MIAKRLAMTAGAALASLLWVSATPAQVPGPGPAPPPAAAFAPGQLDQMLAPIALYPDGLLGQILMAAGYPLDVVQADRWLQEPGNSTLAGASLTAALDALSWDPSVKSLVPFPRVLQMMDGQLDWTERLGEAFIADGAQLDGPLATELTPAPTTAAEVTAWGPDRREFSVPRSPVARVLVVPESVNPGWLAHTADGAALTPVIVNGWQQGWVVPPGEQGTVTLSFPSNATYRTGLTLGLSLLPLLLAMALVGSRRPVRTDLPAQPWASGPLAAAGLLGVGAVIAGVAGVAVFGGALAVGLLMRNRRSAFDRLTLLTAPTGLILAGALLSRYPWRSVDGYIGHSPWVQLPALIALGSLAASLLGPPANHRTDSPDAEGPGAPEAS